MQIHLKLSPSPRPRPAYQLRLFRRTTATPHSVILLIVLQFRHQRLGQYHHLASNIHQSHLNTCCSLEVLSNDDDGERVRVSNYKSELCRVAAPITMVWRCRWLLASAGGGPHSSLSVTSQSAPRHRHTHTLSHCTVTPHCSHFCDHCGVSEYVACEFMIIMVTVFKTGIIWQFLSSFIVRSRYNFWQIKGKSVYIWFNLSAPRCNGDFHFHPYLLHRR